MIRQITGMWIDEVPPLGRNKETWREDKKARAAKTVGWNTYSIHDRETVKKRLYVQHKAKQYVAEKLGQPVPTDSDLEWAFAQNVWRRLRFIGATSKYMPHQGKHECARRMRQEAANK